MSLNIFFSLSLNRLLSNKKRFCSYNSAICVLICVLESCKLSAFTPAKLKKITGYVPCSCLYFSLFHILSPSNKSARPEYLFEKKQLSMLILRVFPKRRGRVMSVTSSPASHHASMRPVLSI